MERDDAAMRSMTWSILRIGLLVFAVSVLVSVPFMVFGETVFVPVFEAMKERTLWLVVLAVALLGADAVLPVPSSWVVIFLAQQAGVLVGIVGGTVGLSIGVVVASWLGKVAVGRVAPRFIPAAEMERLRSAMEKHTVATLACMRSVPVLAETSVLIAAAAGVPRGRIFAATLVPNLAIAVIYSVAAEDSFTTACIAFLATVVFSYAAWVAYLRVRTGRINARAND